MSATDSFPSSEASRSRFEAIDSLLATQLKPLVQQIDQEGLYPETVIRELGALGAFDAAVSRQFGGRETGLAEQIEITRRIAGYCGSTAFITWCQSTSAWYLQHAPNAAVREKFLAPVSRGSLLSGTGMSNTVKHLADIERIHLQATRDGDTLVVNGSLPWVSNLGDGHIVIVAASIENEGYAMFAVECKQAGLALKPCPDFSGYEGTRTFNLRFADVRVPAEHVLAQPAQFREFIRRIKPGFILGQIGIGLGIVDSSLKIIRDSNLTHEHVNVFLDDQYDDLKAELDAYASATRNMATLADTDQSDLLPVLQARAAASELGLKATQSAALHAGAKGYLMRHAAQRLLREALFVAIVTPALKHLRKEIRALQNAKKAA